MNSGTKVFGSIALLIGLIIGLSVYLGRQTRTVTAEPPAPTQTLPAAPEKARPANAASARRPTNSAALLTATNLQIRPTVPAVPPAAAGLITNWNEKIDEALTSGAEDREVAKTLLKSFPRFPQEGQVEAVQHISNLLPDEDYPELGKLMEDATLPEDVLDELIMDLLNRPNKIMLPELVKVARNSQHAKAGEAKDFLELYLEEDYGADWNLWQTKVDEWLKANPDE